MLYSTVIYDYQHGNQVVAHQFLLSNVPNLTLEVIGIENQRKRKDGKTKEKKPNVSCMEVVTKEQ